MTLRKPVLAELAPGKTISRLLAPMDFGYGFAEDLAEVGGDGEVAAFVELLVG
jgi:hypothetical protein